MFCKKCGKEVQKEWTVCPNCGEKINETKESEKGTKMTIQNASSGKDKKKGSFKKKIFGLIAIIIIIIIGVSTCGGSETDEQKEMVKEESTQGTENEINVDEPENIEVTDESANENTEATDESANENADYTVAQLYTLLQDNEDVPYVLSEKALNFLTEHEDYFPATNYEHIAKAVDTSIEYRHIEKKASKYGDKLMELPELYVGTIEEEEIGKMTLTIIQALDVGENVYYIYYNDSLDDVFKEDIIKVNLLPFGVTSYDNVSGGTTKSLIGAGSYIEKIE